MKPYLCCHDDYTLTGGITLTDMAVFVGYQNYASQGYPGYTIGDDDLLTPFLSWYDTQVSAGAYVAVSGVQVLPGDPKIGDTDCANFTETENDVINLDDMNIFIGYQNYASQGFPGYTPNSSDNLLDKFVAWYDTQVSAGAYVALSQPPKHLPSLQSEDQVWTTDGLVDKNCEQPEIWDTAGNADQDGLIIITTNLSETLTTNTDEGDTTTGSTVVECEYVPFSSTGADQEYIVPEGVTSIFAHVWGAGGSSGRYTEVGGSGGYAEGQFAVTPGEKLILGVGQTSQGTKEADTTYLPGYSPGGRAGKGGGYNNDSHGKIWYTYTSGGITYTAGTRGSGAGGGMSGIFRGSISPETAIIIAGGGGGAAGNVTLAGAGGGAGGGTEGSPGSRYPGDSSGGKGGTQTQGGEGGKSGNYDDLNKGYPGSQFNGGDASRRLKTWNRLGYANQQSSAGGGGAGWFGGGGGATHRYMWGNDWEGAQDCGGGGSGYLDNVVELGLLTTGNPGKRNGGYVIKSPKPNMINCTDDTIIPCTPDFICILEPGNGSDIPANLLGLAGTYQYAPYGDFDNRWERLTDYLGNKKPSSEYGELVDQINNGDSTHWVYTEAPWGYSDYVLNNPGSNIYGPQFKFFDSENNEIDCIPKATSVSFHLDWDKKIPIIVTPTECPPAECTFEISNIIDTQPTGAENTIGTFDLTINLSSLYDYGTSGYVRAMEAEFIGIELAKDNAIIATTFDLYKNDPTKTDEEREMWTELSNKTQTILSSIGETTESRNKIMFADLLQNQGFKLADYANTTITFTITYTQKFTEYFYVSSAYFYDSSIQANQFYGVICTPNTPTPSPTITPSPTVSPTITSTPTLTPTPTVCFEDTFCITESNVIYGLHGNYDLVPEESDINGATYIAVASSEALNSSTHAPIKIKQIGGYSSNIWQIQKSDDDKEAWPILEYTNSYLNKDLYFYDENMNPEHCIANVRFIKLEDVVIKSHGSTNNVQFMYANSSFGYGEGLMRYIVSTNSELFVAGTSNWQYDTGITYGNSQTCGLEYNNTNDYAIKSLYCNPLGINYTYPDDFIPQSALLGEGIYYRNWINDFDYYQKVNIPNVVKVRTGYTNTGMLVQTDNGDVYGTGHFKKSTTENYTKLEELNGIDIDELVTIHTTCFNNTTDTDPTLNFAFAYIDKEDDSKLVYFVPSFDTISYEEYILSENIIETCDNLPIQANLPFISEIKRVETSGMTDVKSIITLAKLNENSANVFIVQTNDNKLWTHGDINLFPKHLEFMRYSDFNTLDPERRANNKVLYIDYSNAFENKLQKFTEITSLPQILYSTKEQERLLSPVDFYISSIIQPDKASSYLSSGTYIYLNSMRHLQAKLFKSGVDYDTSLDPMLENVTLFRIIHHAGYRNIEGQTTERRYGFNSPYSVSFDTESQKFMFGRITFTNTFEFANTEDVSGIVKLITNENENYNVVSTDDFINKIEKVTCVRTNLVSKNIQIGGGNQYDSITQSFLRRTNEDGSKLDSDVHMVSFLFKTNGYSTVAVFDLNNINSKTIDLQNSDEYNFGITEIYEEGEGTNIQDITPFGFTLGSGPDVTFAFNETDRLSNSVMGKRSNIVNFGLGLSEVFISDECNFEPATPTPTRTTSFTPSPTFTCGEPDYTEVENTFVCVDDLILQFVGFDMLESKGGRPVYETPSGDARIFWDGYQGWIFVRCIEPSEKIDECYSTWTHSIPNACDFYPWEADWSVTDLDPRIQHLVDDRGGVGDNATKYFDYWYTGSPYGGESDYYGIPEVKNCTPCDACLTEPNQYYLSENGSPAVNSLSAEWYRDFGGSLCYGLIHYTQNENFQIFKTFIAYVENDTIPIGTITITGDFVNSNEITYQTYNSECYIATPTIEGSQNVYRFIKEEATPTPTDTSSPTHTPSPTFTPSPSPTITPSPTESPTHTPSMTPSVTPSPTESPTHTPSATPSVTPSPTETPSPTPEDCLPDITTGNNKSYPEGAPVNHIGGGTFEWCGGTKYADPGLLTLKDLCDTTDLTIENGGVEVLYFDNTGTIAITNPTEIEKLGLFDTITLDNSSTIGPNEYTFKVKYKLSYGGQTKIGGGRSINVVNCNNCCDQGMLTTNISVDQITTFGEPTITVTGVTDNATICVGTPQGGLPYSLKIIRNNLIVAVLTTVGTFNDSKVYYTTSEGTCLQGTIEDDECILIEWDFNSLNKIVHFDFSNTESYNTVSNQPTAISNLIDLTSNFTMANGAGTLETTSGKTFAHFDGISEETHMSSNESTITDSDGNHWAIGIFYPNTIDNSKDSFWSFETSSNPKRDYAISAGSSDSWEGEIDLDSLSKNRISENNIDKIELKTPSELDFSTYHSWHIFAVVFSKSDNEIYMRIDGKQGSDIVQYKNKLSETAQMRIMRNRGNKTPNAYMKEFFGVASNPHTIESGTTEIQKAEGYLAHKWGLESLLPTDHPFKLNGPI